MTVCLRITFVISFAGAVGFARAALLLPAGRPPSNAVVAVALALDAVLVGWLLLRVPPRGGE